MKFCLIDPKQKTVELAEAENLQDLYPAIGLDAMEVDHGVIHREPSGYGASIVAYEFGLFKGIEDGHYFSIAGRLYEGPAVIYAFDPQGETVDCPRKPAVLFFRSGYEVEDAIRSGQIKRPVNAVNDVVTWRWPDPQPNDK